jgi:hypothetical protein
MQSRQNVHSYEQIIASGASGRLQFSHAGRNSSMFALSQGAVPRRPTRREHAAWPHRTRSEARAPGDHRAGAAQRMSAPARRL